MDTRIDEVADRIVRISTFVPDAGLTFNQFLLRGEEPLLFHTGMRHLFADVSAALGRVEPLARIRWISFGHFEADECGALNEWLAVAPHAQAAVGFMGTILSVADFAHRAPRTLDDGEVLDLGGLQVRYLPTPHVPHGWDAGLLFEETTRTLLCGDLFTTAGECGPTTEDSVLPGAIAAEDMFGATALTPSTAPTIRRLAELAPEHLALMHGPTFHGDGAAELRGLADDYQRRLEAGLAG